jgi:4-hydroxybenzoate polyprenyltransferase
MTLPRVLFKVAKLMPVTLSQRLLAILQFTRLALVFTAISNAWAALLLRAHAQSPDDVAAALDPKQLAAMTIASIGLYGFGMSLNDVIDRRRDATIAADRPLPSGRLPLRAGRAICLSLLAMGLAGGVLLAEAEEEPHLARMTLLLTLGVATLIAFYDLAGKYLISLGLLTLGLIRFFHATIADPTLATPWHPLVLLDHVAILSTLAYAWEQKRPALTRRHFVVVLGGLAIINAGLITTLILRRSERAGGWAAALDVTPGLAWPAAAIVGFFLVVAIVRSRHRDSRGAGKVLMLFGLLYLIVYDAAFVAGDVGWQWALALLMLLPIAWASVKLMRAWSTIVALSEKPRYIPAE